MCVLSVFWASWLVICEFAFCGFYAAPPFSQFTIYRRSRVRRTQRTELMPSRESTAAHSFGASRSSRLTCLLSPFGFLCLVSSVPSMFSGLLVPSRLPMQRKRGTRKGFKGGRVVDEIEHQCTSYGTLL